MNRLGISLVDSYLTLDSGFDDGKNRNQIEYANLIPVIKPNLRGLRIERRSMRNGMRLRRCGDIPETIYH